MILHFLFAKAEVPHEIFSFDYFIAILFKLVFYKGGYNFFKIEFK